MTHPTGPMLCPICEGSPDVHCYCDGTGLVSAREARQMCAELGTQPKPAPRVPEAMKSPCAGCAFRPGSPELESCTTLGAIVAGVAKGEPFFCHQGMLVDARDSYIPRAWDDKGRPVGHPLCSGWEMSRAAAGDSPTPLSTANAILGLGLAPCVVPEE